MVTIVPVGPLTGEISATTSVWTGSGTGADAFPPPDGEAAVIENVWVTGSAGAYCPLFV